MNFQNVLIYVFLLSVIVLYRALNLMPCDDFLTSLPPHKTASYLESLLRLANNVFKSTLSKSNLEYQGKTLH